MLLMENFSLNNVPKFKSPQEELEFLRAHIREREKALNEDGQEVSHEELTNDVIEEYKEYEPQEVMHDKNLIPIDEAEKLILRLHPEAHDRKMEEMLGLLLDKGISSTLSIISIIWLICS